MKTATSATATKPHGKKNNENVNPNKRSSDDSSSSSDDDDNLGPLLHGNRKKKMKASKGKGNSNNTTNSGYKKKSTRPIPTQMESLPALTVGQKQAVLQSIDNENDRNLQVILWTIDCNYTLLEHQFKGVRALAGVPDSFPGTMVLKNKTLLQDEEEAIFDWTVKCLQTVGPRLPDSNNSSHKDRGVLMADVMGLGKTVQAVAACILRNGISLCKDQAPLPTLIVSPNDAVLTQWHETLIKAGVPKELIYRFAAKDSQQRLKGDIYLLCNRYDLQTEARHVFSNTSKVKAKPKTVLFPNASRQLLLVMKNQYEAEKGTAKNLYKPADKEQSYNPSKIITQYLSSKSNEVEYSFRTVIVDEAHFLKSLTTYWGIAAGLVGLHAERMIPMSGTPYNNGCQDLATLMTMIDPTLESANEEWWKRATSTVSARTVAAAISEWNKNYVIRRDKSVIAANLPQKTVAKKQVAPYPLELAVYENYESKFMSSLQHFINLERGPQTPFQRRLMKELMSLMMAYASCMRSSLIHPVLPGHGRDLTVLFSPTRRNMRSVLTSLERTGKCVCCPRKIKQKQKKKKEKSDTIDTLDDENLGDEDDDDFDDLDDFIVADDYQSGEEDDKDDDDDNDRGDEDEAEEVRKRPSKYTNLKKAEGKGELFALPDCICELAAKGIRHFACETCLEDLEASGGSCPLCESLKRRVTLESGRLELMQKKAESTQPPSKQEDGTSQIDPADMTIPRPIYCADILGGFRASAKLDSIVSDFKTKVPEDEKVLIASFFKGSLDLLEAIFDELNVEVARFDGDIGSEDREAELRRFKNRKACRVLLMTVQTGGTGLNLVCANHVWFVDRFWNPMVMEQCEDRCYRLGQKKDVDITYHDVSFTIDDVMRHINNVKTTNATVILADGSQLSTSTAGLSYKDISGCLGGTVRAVQAARLAYLRGSPSRIMEPLPPPPEDMLEGVTKDTGRMQHRETTSMLDAMAVMLGYAPPPISPTKMTIRATPTSESKNGSGTEGNKPTPMEISSSDANGEDRKPAPTATATDSSDTKPTPMEVVSSSSTSTKAKARGNISMLDDDSDDDSIPDAVLFKSSKK